ncbi:4Fe-4S dicluster domain-containing protein [Desulfonatronovibrio magnus]|uniref:4Fe-4S dicluster domain-containing protein n=1 Tax=Desulfonatronovibrio magnus TaxID=698827 RepID=UPI0005EB9B50|nr:4Fe-4S dicluster domain-containing protein [Desulfonatronovibrio magnus]
MSEINQILREAAKKLLQDKKVQSIIGFRKGVVPMREQPFFARTISEADQLVWTGFCTNNPAKFLINADFPVAVVAQGCVSRNINILIRENRIKRDNVHILGVHSPGMLDRFKIAAEFPGRYIHEVQEHNEDIYVSGPGFEENLNRRRFKRDNCYTCTHRNPVLYDQMLGTEGSHQGGGNIDKVAAPWLNKSSEQRWEMFNETFKKCVRCYACRDACPLCYCKTCFVDNSKPQWCGKTIEETDVHTFHILRAFHCAGRCTDCGACESACPEGIKMRRLTSRLELDIRQMYGFSPGLSPDEINPLSTFSPEDPEDFIG